MTAPETTITTPRVTAHSTCDHPKTKVARAACRRARRAGWVAIVRGDERIRKGLIVRVTTNSHVEDELLGEKRTVISHVEGELLGWGEKRIVIRDTDGDRTSFDVPAVLRVEIKNDDDEADETDD
jgi:hypothetical protein